MNGDELNKYAGRLISETGRKVKTVDDMVEEVAVLCEAFELDFLVSIAAQVTSEGSMYHKSIASPDQQHLVESGKSMVRFMDVTHLYELKNYIEERLEKYSQEDEEDATE